MNRIPITATSSFDLALSIENRITASTMFTVNRGTNNDTVDTIKSYIPTSSADKTLVYNGTSKNTKILDAKLLIVSIPTFLNKYLERLFI